MNVLIMGNFSYPQGMAGTKRVQHFVDHLKSHKVSVKILLLRKGRTEIPKSDWSGIHKGIFYKTIGNDLNSIPSVLWGLPSYFLQGSMFLIKMRKRNEKNILYSYGGPSIENIWFIIVAKILGYKTVFDIVEDHTYFTESLHLTARIKLISLLFFQKIIHRLSDGLVVISCSLMKKYKKQIGQTIPIAQIPISAKISEESAKIRLGFPVKVVYSGSFASKDDLDLLIDAFETVYQSNKNLELLLTGKGEIENICRIKKKIRKMDGIKYLGYLDDDEFYKFLKSADILCMIRRGSKFANAGFPFKLGEYLATGNPVIASNVGDVMLYLQNLKDAVIVTPGDRKEVKEAIEYLIREPEKAMKIGYAGRQKSMEFFDPQKNGRLLLDLFNQI